MSNEEIMIGSENITEQEEFATRIAENIDVALKGNADQSVPRAVHSMMLSSSIADTNCKEIAIKNMDAQFNFAKLICEHPEQADMILECANNANSSDERATSRFAELCHTIKNVAESLSPIALVILGCIAYKNGWVQIPNNTK